MATEIEQLKLVLSAELDKFNRETGAALKNLQTNSKKGAKALQKVEGATQSLNRIGGKALLKFAAIATTAFSITKIQAYADSFTSVQNRIRTVIDPAQDLNKVTAELLALANETRSSLESTSILYSRLKRNTEELNLSNQDLLDVTRTINQSFKVSGANAQEASAAIVQLSQGLASGTLRGDEFNSVAEQAPVILEAVSAATGISRGELRELAAEGKISADVLIRSLQAYADVIENDFNKANITAEQATERLSNNFTVFVGELDKAIGFTDGSVNSLNNMSDALISMQQPILDTVEFFKDLSGVIGDDLNESAEDFSAIAKDFEMELKFIQELFQSFVFVLETGILSVPELAKSAIEVGIAGIVALIDEGRIKILEFRQFIAEKLGQTGVVEVLQVQIDAIGTGAEDTFDAVISRVEERLGALKTVAADFEKELAEERLERLKEQDEVELEALRERLEREQEIRAEFEKTGKGSVDVESVEASEKIKTKVVKAEEKARGDIRKLQANLAKGLITGLVGDSKAAALAALLVTQGLAAADVVISTQQGVQKAIGQLGIYAGPAVAAIEARGTIALAAIAATTLGSAAGITGGGGGGGGIGAAASSGEAAISTSPLDDRSVASFDVGITGDGGVATSTISIVAAPGDTIGGLLAEWINEGIRKGRIG